MKLGWIAVALAALLVTAAEPAAARSKQQGKHYTKQHGKQWVRRQCDDRSKNFSWGFLLGGRAPEWNGCSPPVYDGAEFVGQDPDPNIRFQLLRDPDTGYHYHH